MNVIRPSGPIKEEKSNAVKPGDTVEWPEVDPTQPIIIKATPVTVQLTPELLIPTRKDAINIPGDDGDKRDYAVKPTKETLMMILRTDAERKQRAATRPPIGGKINVSGEDSWAYVVKAGPRVPRPDLKFNPETFTYISPIVKSRQPRYRVVQVHPTVVVPPSTRPDGHISTRPW